MLNKHLVIVFFFYQCCVLDCVHTNVVDKRSERIFKFSIDELLNTVFPSSTTNDVYLDPCKAGSFVGDIALFDSTYKHHRVKRAATARKERLWDYGVVPYEIDSHFGGHKALLKQAMRHWENSTCLKFVERNPVHHPDYILFTERPCGCCSFVGKQGRGAQAVSLGEHCDEFGIIIHELGHAIGFWHEHTRPDRDKHVKILKDNIMNGLEYNFEKFTENEVNSLGLPYDYNSIMHYSRNTFTRGTYLDTIEPIALPGKVKLKMGQRTHLSEGDIEQTNLLYKCPKCGRTYQASAATFSSPSYLDGKATEEIKCEWRITATHGEKITLNITQLDTAKSSDCKTDYIEIRDGYWHKSPVLGRYCGTGKVPLITSTGSRMLVTYLAQNPNGHAGFVANYEVICGGDILLDSSQRLESINYPDHYLPNKECIWRITVPDTYQVALKFHSFELENKDNCVFDYIEIRDGLTLDSKVIGKFCGYKIPEDIISSSNHLLIKFVSDGSVQKQGFAATIIKEYDECRLTNHGCAQECVNTLGSYECTCKIGYELHSEGKICERACGGTLDVSNGTITSPSFPQPYPPNKKCVWDIIAQPRHKITINFTHFEIEGNGVQPARYQRCEYDRIEIYSKLGDGRLSKHGNYCGNKGPSPITSESNAMRVVFTSDGTVGKSGFAAVFFSDMDECAINNGQCQHKCINTFGSYICACNIGFILDENERDCKENCKYYITSQKGEVVSPNYPDLYPSKRECVWHFHTTPGHRVKLTFQLFELEEHPECANDYVDIYNGDNKHAIKIGRFCGSELPHPIVASGNKLLMVFRSDPSLQRKGFHAVHNTVCGGHLQATFEKQYLYSHTHYGSLKYPRKMDCEWTIRAPPSYNVHINIEAFDLEFEENCRSDYIEIFDGTRSNAPSFGKVCGSQESLDDVFSTYEYILIRFRTDDSVEAKGFILSYEAVELISEEQET